MGQVYRARDPRNDRDVVIKVPHVVLLRDPTFAARFQREVESVRKRRHPAVLGPPRTHGLACRLSAPNSNQIPAGQTSFHYSNRVQDLTELLLLAGRVSLVARNNTQASATTRG
jgi:serine/threonine protein kinase